MRALPSLSLRRSFTLIELLVVISIIAILATMTLKTVTYAMQKGKASRAQAEIVAMAVALERFKNDNGIYQSTTDFSPGPTAPYYATNPTAAPYPGNATLLYESLSGIASGVYGTAPTTTAYMEFKSSQVKTKANPAYVTDPFGYAYGFQSAQQTGGTANTVVYNTGFFDLWSTAGQGVTTNHANTKLWIGNWSSQ